MFSGLPVPHHTVPPPPPPGPQSCVSSFYRVELPDKDDEVTSSEEINVTSHSDSGIVSNYIILVYMFPLLRVVV